MSWVVITNKASKLTLLKEGTPVIIGCGDVIATTLGSSGIRNNQKYQLLALLAIL